MTQPPPYGDNPQYPPQYPPEGYGQPVGYGPAVGYGPPEPLPRSKTPMIVMVVVIALAVLVGGGIALAKAVGGGSGAGGNSPTSAVDGLFSAALRDKDQEKAKSFVCAAEATGLGSITGLGALEQSGGSIDVSWRNLKEVSRTGDEAVVSFDVVLSAKLGDQSVDQSMTLRARVVKEDGVWKVCGAA
jgi:hypothetical protein